MLTTNLWNHQQQIINHCLAHDYSLVIAGMGSGKTLAALELLAHNPNDYHLILTPKPALNVYQEDVDSFYDSYPLTILTLDRGSSKDKANRIKALVAKGLGGVVVVNYETAILLNIYQVNWHTVIADESHRLAGYNTKTSLQLAKQLAHATRRVAMTGTPYEDGYEKLYGVVRWLDPVIHEGTRRYPTSALLGSYNDFLDAYCNTFELQRGVKIINGYRNVDKLAQVIKPFTLKINTADVIRLPGVYTRKFSTPLVGELVKRYRELERDSALEINSANDLVELTAHQLTKLTRLHQLATSGYYLADSGQEYAFKGLTNRVNALKELINTLGDKPVVVFTRFKRDVKIVSAVINEVVSDATVSQLTGERNTLDEWRKGGTQFLIANISAGGVGVRLERADTVIYWSVGYSAVEYEQSLARLVRPGQKASSVNRYIITSKGTIDETIYTVLSNKANRRDKLDEQLKG